MSIQGRPRGINGLTLEGAAVEPRSGWLREARRAHGAGPVGQIHRSTETANVAIEQTLSNLVLQDSSMTGLLGNVGGELALVGTHNHAIGIDRTTEAAALQSKTATVKRRTQG